MLEKVGSNLVFAPVTYTLLRVPSKYLSICICAYVILAYGDFFFFSPKKSQLETYKLLRFSMANDFVLVP